VVEADVERLLTTKLNIPPARPQTVPRPRLIERLEEALGYNLILVSAPAGFGKTTLLSEWARILQPQVSTTWISLDKGDNDPTRFWDYFIAALQALQPGCGEKILPWLHSSQPPSTEAMLTALINEISVIKGDFIIVLDDYHLIDSQQIHDGIIYLLEHLPVQVHLVIATRADPPLPLARFRGKGMMLEIRTNDLRFNKDDAANLLKELKAPQISAKDIAALNERTEGWVVGLKMAALSIRGQQDIPGFIAAFTGSQRYIMDYLMEEVLQRQTQEVNDFLVKTSVLERLSGPLCDTITGLKDSKNVLLNLERSHLFIVPLDESRQWYRYEHLFADLLRHQCETVYGKEQVATLHQRASQWYEDNNFPDEAIYHAQEAKDWEGAIRLIDAHREAWQKLGEFNSLVGWLRAVPQEILRQHLNLYSRYASFLAAVGRMDAAEAVLSYLEAQALDDATWGQVAFTRGIIYRHRGDTRCIELFEKAYTLAPPDDVAMRCRAATSIAHVQQRYSNFQEAKKWATITCELGQQAGDIPTVLMSMAQIGIVNTYQGKVRYAVEIYEKANELAGQAVSMWTSYDMLCLNQYYLNDLEAAAENARLVIERYESSGEDAGMITVYFYQAQICLARGDEAGADVAIEKLDEASRQPTVDSIWYATYITHRLMYAIRRDNIEEAARWGERLPELAGMMLFDRPAVARLLLAQGKKEAAVRLLQELYEKSTQLGAAIVTIRLRVYQALAADNEAAALGFLAEALTMAEPEGVIRFFVDEGKLLKSLLEKALSKGITPEFNRNLLDIIDKEERQRRARKLAIESLPPLSLLSEREIEVLRLLADDIPNVGIAEKLCVSLGTVKTHVHHIIDKLGVKDRRQAVQRGGELKLL
jgi:LuxR family maltose regulon positive regulatory protein